MMANNINEGLKRFHEHAKRFLSAEQLEIIQTIEFSQYGLDAGLAGAGAGKTRCLSYLVVKALLTPRIKRVYILTSTRTAKDEAFSRANALYDELGLSDLGIQPLNSTTVKTMHAFGLKATRYANEKMEEWGCRLFQKARCMTSSSLI